MVSIEHRSRNATASAVYVHPFCCVQSTILQPAMCCLTAQSCAAHIQTAADGARAPIDGMLTSCRSRALEHLLTGVVDAQRAQFLLRWKLNTTVRRRTTSKATSSHLSADTAPSRRITMWDQP